MRYLFAVLAVAALSTTFLIARGEETPAKNAKSLKTYTVTVVEFHLKSNAEPTAALSKIAEDFDKLSAGGDVSLVETVKVSVLEQHPTSGERTTKCILPCLLDSRVLFRLPQESSNVWWIT